MASERIAVVTGATSGIGRAIALELLEGGARVVATGRSEGALKDLAAMAEGGSGELLTLIGDVRETHLMDELFDTARRAWGREPDLVVAAAGHGLPGTLLDSDDAGWAGLVEVNYLAALRHLRTAGRRMRAEAQQGRNQQARDIVVLGSTAGRQVSAANPVYGSTKFALHGAVEGLRQELCAHGVRVTLIEPGFVKTGFQERAGYDPVWFAQVEADNGPLLTGADIARTVAFAVGQPAHVHLDDIRIRPTRQRA
ncbi:SDR family oxidoreductase [Catenulispora subtropica]|uniref:SDR family oxidoreductase n=1 Tax=Catenulispora subtropica TaxID=450798 RepID=A0ABN2TAD0_9ACTN